jgi:hypothetical protein
MIGDEFKKWLNSAAAEHLNLMTKAGFVHKGS